MKKNDFSETSYAIVNYFKSIGKQSMLREYEVSERKEFMFTQGGKQFKGIKLSGKARIVPLPHGKEKVSDFDFAYTIINNEIKILKRREGSE